MTRTPIHPGEILRDELEEVAKVEQFPKMEGRQMIMVVAPK